MEVTAIVCHPVSTLVPSSGEHWLQQETGKAAHTHVVRLKWQLLHASNKLQSVTCYSIHVFCKCLWYVCHGSLTCWLTAQTCITGESA